jgi:hypothetical protein
VEDLFINEYKMLLEQSMNIGNLYRQGEFEFVDSNERHEDFLDEIDYFKSQGRL